MSQKRLLFYDPSSLKNSLSIAPLKKEGAVEVTSEKVIEVLSFYRMELRKSGVQAVQLEEGQYLLPFCELPEGAHSSHTAWMCDQAIEFVETGMMEKAFRWLGYIQCALYRDGVYCLDDLKEHSRPRT